VGVVRINTAALC